MMGCWGNIALVALVSLHAIILLPPRAAAQDVLSPLLSPILNETCKAVQCGKGTCQPSLSHAFGFVCDCKPGWSQVHIDDHLRFLPCVIPNCSLNYSCSNDSPASAPSSSPPPSNVSLFDPCFWSFCGGGSCIKTSTFEHRCDCKEGYSNLLNATSFPCLKDCSIGADCTNLGISLPNSSSSSSSPDAFVEGSSSCRDYSAQKILPWFFFMMAHLTMIQVA